MDAWAGWELDRAVVVFAAVAYVVLWIQLSLYHWAGAFKHWAMWGPVLATPLAVLGAVIGALARDGVWGWIALVLLAFGIVEGLSGVFFHLRGVQSQIGGLTTRNLLSGPPPLLPVAYTAIGALGVGALVWNA